MTRRLLTSLVMLSALFVTLYPPHRVVAEEPWAGQVTIHRDEWGVPHVRGPSDASVVFGFAYAQAEDYFWQIEDSYLQALGRYAEVVGERGLASDVLNRQFEIARRSEADFPQLEPAIQQIYTAHAAGLNYFLERHPSLAPRLLKTFEPWHGLALERQTMLTFLFGKAHLSEAARQTLTEESGIGSNAWAISPSRTKSGAAMLFVNPHQPWFGPGQYYEGHIVSDEGWNFSGATFFGMPFPRIGHNDRLGWSHTVNNPDVADVYRVTFDDSAHPLQYRYGDGHRDATEWRETIRVQTTEGIVDRQYEFLKTHYGPVIGQEGPHTFLAVRIARLFDGIRVHQALAMTKAKDFATWRKAMTELALPMFNTAYADVDGNIFYVYNAAVPRRDPKFDWTKPVDGGDPATEWQGFLTFDELPQTLNPQSGYVQTCNSSPFTTTDDGNPSLYDFPRYLAEDQADDKRRAKVSRMLLRELHDVTFDQWQKLAFDTTLYWPLTELPRMKQEFEQLKAAKPDLASRAAPYFEHLLDWDSRCTADSTATTLCVAWYEELYGRTYPAEILQEPYLSHPDQKFDALARAAERLSTIYGDWRVRWGDVSRLQRPANVPHYLLAPFDDNLPSLPCVGVPGPLGVVFNTYYSPATAERPKRYGMVGHSFVAVYAFGKKIQARSILPFGASGDPKSPHYFDQAALFSQQQFKPAWFDWDDVLEHTVRKYHPGEEVKTP